MEKNATESAVAIFAAHKRYGLAVVADSACLTFDEPAPFLLVKLVGRAGFEPATNGLKVRCSTN